jgi:hypothetical protein
VGLSNSARPRACSCPARGKEPPVATDWLWAESAAMSGHYASGDLGRLMREANLVLNRQETRTMLRIVAGRFTSPKTATSENHATGTCG